MVEVLGVSASILGLLSVTFNIIQEIRAARDRVKGASKTLYDTSARLEQLERSLHLVQEQGALRTTAIQQQLSAISNVARELRSFFDRLAAAQAGSRFSLLRRALKSGDKDDHELAGILTRLDSERDELTLRISVAHVGLTGDLQGGMRAAYGILQETNEKVKQLGVREVEVSSWETMERLEGMKGRQPDGLDATQTALVENRWSPGQELATGRGLPRMASETEHPSLLRSHDHMGGSSIYDSIAVGQVKIMAGNIGMEGNQTSSRRKAVVAHTRAGKDMMVMTGDVGGQAAVDFARNFWGR